MTERFFQLVENTAGKGEIAHDVATSFFYDCHWLSLEYAAEPGFRPWSSFTCLQCKSFENTS